MNKSICALLFLCSCAHHRAQEPNAWPEKIEHLESILNLSKTSYIRGCIEGMNHLIPKQTKGKRLDFCVESSQKHTDEMRGILEGATMKKQDE